MERIKAIKKISSQLTKQLVICNIGFPSRELFHVKDLSTHFYMLGSMGLASSIGLGLAMSTTRKVVVFDGDGSILMNLGSLVTIFNQNPENLILIVLDNECYGSTGSQCTYASTVDLGKVAKSIGFKTIFFFKNSEEINFKKVLKSEGPIFVHFKVKKGNANVPVIPMEPVEIRDRFMDEIKNPK
ncbi:MAG: sulfopyruvate decarboxylase subunit beta [Methanobacterium sp.]|nr:sulfopyruvate decarboxylase subunit beta [Methanobacterium sp.]